MSHISLYRKWRPKTFDEVRGRDDIVTILRNEVKNNKIAHAYLFCGTRGTGKTSIAKILARAVNCDSPIEGSPCYNCNTCKNIDVNPIDIIEIDAASNNGVDNIREIRSDAEYLPSVGKYKVYIIDEVHMLSQGAFNALLKILEEPPSHIIFILATTELSKIPVTIISRCQRFDFTKIETSNIKFHLKDIALHENVEITDEALQYIATVADGGFRDAISLFEQIISFVDNQVIDISIVMKLLGKDSLITYHNLFQYIRNKDMIKINQSIDDLLYSGKSIETLVIELANYIKNILSMKLSNDVIDNITKEDLKLIVSDTELFNEYELFNMLNTLANLSETLKRIDNKRMYLDVNLIQLLVPKTDENLTSLSNRIEQISENINNKENSTLVNINSVDVKKNTSTNDNLYDVKNFETLNFEFKDIISKWKDIKWNEEIGSHILDCRDFYSINIEGDALVLLCHAEIIYKKVLSIKEKIIFTINKYTGHEIDLIVKEYKVNDKSTVDLSLINFDIEMEN